MIKEELEKLSKESIRIVFKRWNVKYLDYKALIKKYNSKKDVMVFYSTLSDDLKNLILLILTSQENTSFYKLSKFLKYKSSNDETFNLKIEELRQTGFVYIRKKRAKLTQNEDNIYIFGEIKEAIEENIIKSEKEINLYSKNISYVESTYKKYEKEVIRLYEKSSVYKLADDNSFDVDILSELYFASIVDIKIVKNDSEEEIIYYIHNSKIKNNISKYEEKSFESITFLFNHMSVIADIEKFIRALVENRVRKLKNGNIDLSLMKKKNLGISTLNLNYELVFDILLTINLVKFVESSSEYVLDYNRFSDWSKLALEEKVELIIKTYYGYTRDDIEVVKEYVEQEGGTINVNRLVSIFNYNKKSSASIEDMKQLVYTLYLCGIVEVGVNDNSEIITVRFPKMDAKYQCIVNSSFDVVLVGYTRFSSELMYMLNLYTIRNENDSIHSFHFSESTIMIGEDIFSESEIYSLNYLIELLNKELSESQKEIPKNVITTLQRWKDRIYNCIMYSNAFLIEIEKTHKIDEILAIMKRDGIRSKKVGVHHAILYFSKHDNIKKIVKIFRKEKINIHILNSDDNVDGSI